MERDLDCKDWERCRVKRQKDIQIAKTERDSTVKTEKDIAVSRKEI